MTDTPDYGTAYAELEARLCELLRECEAVDVEQIAPATPGWRVRDVVAHLAGVCDDVMQGNMEGVASDPWTAAQVEKRRGLPFDEVLTEWSGHVPAITKMMNDVPIDAWGQMLADAATHEHDVRGALGRPGARESTALLIGFEWGMLGLGQRLASEGRGRLRITHEAGTFDVGTGDPVSTLRASRFEVARAMAGRRSIAQLHGYEWGGPLEPEVLLLSTDIFTPPAADLVE